MYHLWKMTNFFLQVINFQKVLLVHFFLNNLTDFSTQQCWRVVFLFKFFVKSVNNRDFLKIINLQLDIGERAKITTHLMCLHTNSAELCINFAYCMRNVYANLRWIFVSITFMKHFDFLCSSFGLKQKTLSHTFSFKHIFLLYFHC